MSWIKMYVPDLDVTAQEYTDAMTLSGTKVEGFEKLDADLDKIVIGQIEKIEKHPDADKLIICQVNIGTETVQIVTGAPNVKEGDKVPVVLDGGRVAGGHDGQKTPGGIKIKKGKLRGVESFGMMCSIEELGSTREMYPEAPEYGIYIFPEDAVVGESAIKALGLDDVVIEYEITSNRVDCYGVLGIAREAAATFDKKFVPPVIKETGNDEKASDYVKVTVEDPELCPRYTARVVKNVKIGPSPKWMQRCLASNGIRPINNLVDITNYVMEEYGQPMHAYDLDTIEGREIVVRRAKTGEKFVTLDGERPVTGRSGHRQGEGLRPQVLHIDDKGNPVFLSVSGGVVGAAQGRYGAVNRVGLFPVLEIGPHPAGKEPMAEKPPQTYIFRVARLGQKGDLCRQGEVPFPPGLLGPMVKIRCHQLHPMFPAQTPGQADEAAGAVGVEVRDEVGQQENVHTAAPFSRLRAGKPIHRPVVRSFGNARVRQSIFSAASATALP